MSDKNLNSLGDKGFEMIASRFRVLGDPLRLQLLHLLVDRERTVGDLVASSGTSQANVSKHLQILRRAGLVTRRKEGLQAWYAIADPSIFALCDLVCGRLQEQFQRDLAAIGERTRRDDG